MFNPRKLGIFLLFKNMAQKSEFPHKFKMFTISRTDVRCMLEMNMIPRMADELCLT